MLCITWGSQIIFGLLSISNYEDKKLGKLIEQEMISADENAFEK